ncbi:hypothetical protein K0T92_16140 [Paenibacillus oenotherae]|uniref:Uncharacterized protein n=1 Tax=Paenibacillus oenotherae TaxID=1435645 RepID=A0ABS7D8K2_9BACL|nr:hypothetical protein [Paenibacillus oenotherae]MBW7476267.1 hypothetical protein [Paenibacillus oenotherae]
MREWWGHCKTEWRLSVRGAHLWLLLFVGATHAWLVHSLNKDWKHFGYYIHQFEFLFLGALAILAVLSGVYSARRDRANGVEQLMGSIPYSSVSRWSAKFIVFTIPFLLFAIAPVVIYLWGWKTRFPDASLYPALFLLSMIVPMLYAGMLGWFLGVLLNNRFGYFLGFLLFFLHIYGGMLMIVPNLPKAARLLPNFLLLDYKSMSYFDDQWGFSHDLSFWMHRGFYFFLAGTLFFLFILAAASRRKERGIRVHRTAAFLCLMAAVVCLISHVAIKSGQKEIGSSMAPLSAADFAALYDTEVVVVKPVIDYELAIEPLGGENVRIKATLLNPDALEPANSTVSLLLNPLFEVETVKADEKILTFQRNDNRLDIELPEALSKGTALTVLYKGKIKDHHTTSDGLMTPIHAANKWKVNLPADFEWYPQAANGHSGPRSVTVTYPEPIRLFSNFDRLERAVEAKQQVVRFQSKDARGFSLWGGALKEIAVSSDGFHTKAVVNELVDDEYARKQVNIFHHANRMMEELYQPESMTPAAALLLRDWIQSGVRGSYLTPAGYFQMQGYLFNGLYSDEEAVKRIISCLVASYELFSGPLGEENESIFLGALSAYLEQQLDGEGYQFSASSAGMEGVEPLIAYIKAHGKEQNERLLRDLYNELRNNESAVPDIAALLQKAR